MRVMMALLLGLYLVVPARAADGGPVLLLPGLSGPTAEAAPGYRCADFLEEAGLRPEGLEYLFCRPATEPRTGRRTLTARYRVPGPQAAAVDGLAGAHRHDRSGTPDGYLAAAGRRGRSVRPAAKHRGGQARRTNGGHVFFGPGAAGRSFRRWCHRQRGRHAPVCRALCPCGTG